MKNLILIVLLISATAFGADNSQKITASSPLTLGAGVLAIPAGSASVNGYISSTDWSTFNSKASPGSYITALTGDVTATGPGAAASTVLFVGTSSSANIHTAEVLANAATSANTANQIVKRGASGNVTVGPLTATSGAFSAASNVTGSADAVQLIVKGFSTQTNDVFELKNSANSNLFTVDNSGNGTLTGTVTATNLSGSNTGDVTLGAFGSTPDAKGATLSGQNLVVQPADASHPGSVSIGSQTFGGAKTFSGVVTAATTVQTTIQDPGAVASIDVSNRRLKDSTAVNSGDYQVRTLNDTGGVAVLAWGGAQTAAVTGNADKVQLQVKGFSTQTNNLFSVLKSDNTSLFSVANSGNAAAGGNLSATGTVTGSNLSGTNTGDVTLGTANGLSLAAQVLSLQAADSSHTGALTSSDWTTFNSKQAAGSYITALTGDITASGPGSAAATVAAVGGSTAANVHSAELLANAATTNNTASTIVKRDVTGSFLAGDITANSVKAAGATSFVQAKPSTTGTDAIIAVNNSGSPGDVSFAWKDSTLTQNFRMKADYSLSPVQLGFFYNTTNFGQYDANGKWIIGASGGTQAHALNGSLVSTGNITAPAFISSASNPASAGFLRAQNTGLLSWRNGANSADLSMQVNASNNFLFDTGLNGVRIGTATFISSSGELLSLQSNYSSAPASNADALAAQTVVTTNSAVSNAILGGAIGTVRAITANTTDTGTINTLKLNTSVNTGSGNNYANSTGMSAIVIAGLAQFGTGSFTTTYDALNFGTDTTTVTGYKDLVYFAGLSNGTLGTAFLTDNHAFSGDYAINFSTTKPSRFNGVLTNTDTTATTSSTTGSIVANGGIAAAGQIFSGSRLQANATSSGAAVRVDAVNSSNTASSDALVAATTAGASGGNPFFQSLVTGGAVWSFGLNHGDSDSFEVSPASSLAGNVFKISTGGATTIGASGGTLTHNVNGNTLQVLGTNAAGPVQVSVQNASTNALGDAKLGLSVASTAAGDPYVLFDVPSNNWSVGVDNSDSKKFKLNFSSTPSGANTFLSATTAGAFTLGDAAGASTHTILGQLTVSPGGTSGYNLTSTWNTGIGKGTNGSVDSVLVVSGSGLSTTSQTGIYVSPTDTTAAVNDFTGVSVQWATPNSVFTTARAQGLFVSAINKGASNVITRAASAFLSPQTVGTTGNATITDAISSVNGNFFIFSTDTNPSQFGGSLRAPNGTVAAPAYSFSGSTGSGAYFGTGAVRFAFAGSQVFNYTTGSIDFSQSGNIVSIADGSAAVPTISFPSHSGTGIYRGAAEGVGIAANGATTAVFSNVSEVFTQQLQAPDGSAAAPAYGFANGTQSTGLYRIGAGDIAVSTVGTKRLEFDNVGNVIAGSGTTTASKTADFLYVETTAGTPTGVPANSYAGLVPMNYDSTNNVLQFYNSAWKSPFQLGVTDGSSAASGIVGELVQSNIAAGTAWPTTTGIYGDGTSISLTAGDWMITAMLNTVRGGSNVTIQNLGISTTTGNSSTGLVAGQNLATDTVDTLGAGTDAFTSTVPSWNQNITSTTTYYLKVNATFAAAAPTYSARLSARRMR